MEDNLDKARVLQRQYSVLCEAVPPMNSDTIETPNQLDNIVFSVSMVKKRLRIMNAQSAPGLGEIHPRVLQHPAGVLAAPLENIFTKSMETGRLPPAWKSALVKPMFKGELGMIQLTIDQLALHRLLVKPWKGLLRTRLRDTLRERFFGPLLNMAFKREGLM